MRLLYDMLTWIIWQAEPTCSSLSPYISSFSPPFAPLCSHTLAANLSLLSEQRLFLGAVFAELSGAQRSSESPSLSLCSECFCPFIDFLLFNYIHAFCVGSLSLRLCIWGSGRNAGSRQMDFWWGVGAREKAEKALMKFVKLLLLPCLPLFLPLSVTIS